MIVPPHLRANQDEERHATWLESLYDLVFAVSVFALGDGLASNASWVGFSRFAFLFLVIWWSWLGPTIYLTRFDTNDLIHQAITLGQMLAAALLTTQLPHVFVGDASVFVISFLCIRYSLLAMYLRARWYIPAARDLTSVYLVGFGIGTLLWTASLLAAPSIQYTLWIAGMAIEIATPWVGQRVLRRMPVDVSHLPERFAQFNLIVLGENMYEIIVGLGEAAWSAATLVAAALLFCLTVVLAGRYFVYTRRRNDTIKRLLGPGQAQIYAHLPFAFGVTMLSAGVPTAIADVHKPLLNAPTLWLLVGGSALCSLAAILLYLATSDEVRAGQLVPRVVLLAITLLVGLGGNWATPLVVLAALLVAGLIGLLLVYQLPENPDP